MMKLFLLVVSVLAGINAIILVVKVVVVGLSQMTSTYDLSRANMIVLESATANMAAMSATGLLFATIMFGIAAMTGYKPYLSIVAAVVTGFGVVFNGYMAGTAESSSLPTALPHATALGVVIDFVAAVFIAYAAAATALSERTVPRHDEANLADH